MEATSPLTYADWGVCEVKAVTNHGTSKHGADPAYNRYVRAAKRSDRRQSLNLAWMLVTPRYQQRPAGSFGRAV